jgi:hypothetical protein
VLWVVAGLAAGEEELWLELLGLLLALGCVLVSGQPQFLQQKRSRQWQSQRLSGGAELEPPQLSARLGSRLGFERQTEC